MSGFVRAFSVSIGTVVAVLFVPAITDGAEHLDDRLARAPIASAIRGPSPVAGIVLLEDILQRIQSIVVANKMKSYAQQAQGQIFSQGLTDPSLAIKPQESSPRKVALAGGMLRITSIQARGVIASKDRKDDSWRPPTEQAPLPSKSTARRAEPQSDLALDERKGTNSEVIASANSPLSKARQIGDKNIGGFDLDGALATVPARSRGVSNGTWSGASTGGAAGNSSRLIASRNQGRSFAANQNDSKQKVADASNGSQIQSPPAAPRQAMADEEHPGFNRMGEALNKLYNVTDQMHRAQNLASNTSAGLSASNSANAPYLKQAKAKSAYQKGFDSASFNAAPKPVTISEMPRVTEFRANESSKKESDALVTESAPPSPSNIVLEPQQSPALFKNIREYESSSKPISRPILTSLNDRGVPNVITGIQLIRLGVVANQAKATIATAYTIKTQQIQGWTVWTVSRKNNPDTAMQLYIKHGMVEAMRVFDRDLLAGELGVELGDNVQSLKSRFGEPAFIIKEPVANEKQSSKAGQNYVYPISQVSFQLARPGRAAPQVVSVLIFNVK